MGLLLGSALILGAILSFVQIFQISELKRRVQKLSEDLANEKRAATPSALPATRVTSDIDAAEGEDSAPDSPPDDLPSAIEGATASAPEKRPATPPPPASSPGGSMTGKTNLGPN